VREETPPVALDPDEAIEAQALARDDRQLLAQRTSVDNGKLVATFVLAFAGALLGPALQDVPKSGFSVTSALTGGVGLTLLLVLIAYDRLEVPRFDAIPQSVSPAVRLDLMRIIVKTVLATNESAVDRLRRTAALSVVFSTSSGVTSCLSMLLR
jgi:hypothetical protein